MNSSTLPSKRERRFFFLSGTFAVGALAASAWYSIRINPEIHFYDEFLKRKLEYARNLDSRYLSKVVISGGSSTAFSIQPKRLLEEYGIPAVNMGLQAGLGPDVIAALGVEAVKPGDTFILAIEPDLLGIDNEHVWGPQFCAATGRWSALNRFKQKPIAGWWLPTYLRPGGQHYLVLFAKMAVGRPLFRYSLDDVYEGGWQTTNVTGIRGEMAPDRPSPDQLTRRSSVLLDTVRNYCEARNIHVYYSVPWKYVPETFAAIERARMASFLADVAKHIRVLPDPTDGIHTDAKYFADVVFHTNAQGAALRTDALANALRAEEGREANKGEFVPASGRLSATRK
jgi:hypothetical protein